MKKYAIWMIGLSAMVGCGFQVSDPQAKDPVADKAADPGMGVGAAQGVGADPAVGVGAAQGVGADEGMGVGAAQGSGAASGCGDTAAGGFGIGGDKPGAMPDVPAVDKPTPITDDCLQAYYTCLKLSKPGAEGECTSLLAQCEPPAPKPAPDCGASACYAKYADACAMDSKSDACLGLLKQCESLAADCSPEPQPTPVCDSTATDECYTKYKDVCGLDPEAMGCSVLLQQCDALRLGCNDTPNPSPCDTQAIEGCHAKFNAACSGDAPPEYCVTLKQDCADLEALCMPSTP